MLVKFEYCQRHSREPSEEQVSLIDRLIDLNIQNLVTEECLETEVHIPSIYGMEAEIQPPLKSFPDSSVSSLIRADWCEFGHPATENSLQYLWVNN